MNTNNTPQPKTNKARIAFEICDNYLAPYGILGDCFSSYSRALAAALAERFDEFPAPADYLRAVRSMIRDNGAPAVAGLDYGEIYTALTESAEYCAAVALEGSNEMRFIKMLSAPARRVVWDCVRYIKLLYWEDEEGGSATATAEVLEFVALELPRASKGRGWLWPILAETNPQVRREIFRGNYVIYFN